MDTSTINTPTEPQFKLPSANRLKLLLAYIVWGAVASLAPVMALIQYDLEHSAATDWKRIRNVSIVCAGSGIVAQWKRHKALLQLPPDLG